MMILVKEKSTKTQSRYSVGSSIKLTFDASGLFPFYFKDLHDTESGKPNFFNFQNFV